MTTHTCVRMIFCPDGPFSIVFPSACWMSSGRLPTWSFYFWLARSIHRKWYPWMHTSGVMRIPNHQLAQARRTCCVFRLRIDHAESQILPVISVFTPRSTRHLVLLICILLRRGLWASKFKFRLLLELDGGVNAHDPLPPHFPSLL